MPVSHPDVSRPRLVRDATFLEADRREIALRRGPHNRLGFAYQVAFVRVLGRFPQQAPLEIDGEILRFVALQLNADAETIHAYARRQQTVSEHQSGASASTCVCARSTPPPENSWHGSSRTKRYGSIAWAWSQSGPEIRERYLAEELLWTSPNHRLEPHELAGRAADAIRNHRYQRLQVDVAGSDIAITKTIRTATLPVETYKRSDPTAAIIESELAAYLAVAGPVRPAQPCLRNRDVQHARGVDECPRYRRPRPRMARGTARPDGHTPCTRPRMDPRPRALAARGRNCLPGFTVRLSAPGLGCSARPRSARRTPPAGPVRIATPPTASAGPAPPP